MLSLFIQQVRPHGFLPVAFLPSLAPVQQRTWPIFGAYNRWEGKYIEYYRLLFCACAGLSNRLCRVGVCAFPNGDTFPPPHYARMGLKL